MPVEAKYVDNDAGVIITGSGVMTGEDLLTFTRGHYSSEEHMRRHRWALCDFSDVESVDVSTHDMNYLVAMSRKASAIITEYAVALVATNQHTYGLCRQWELMVDTAGWKTGVFRSRAEAVQWLRDTVQQMFHIDPSLE